MMTTEKSHPCEYAKISEIVSRAAFEDADPNLPAIKKNKIAMGQKKKRNEGSVKDI